MLISLASLYRTGRGTPTNYREALEWFTKAAEQGDNEAKQYVEIINGKKSKFQGLMDNIRSKFS